MANYDMACGCNKGCDRFCCEKKVIWHKPECRVECHNECKCHKEKVCHWHDECKCRKEKQWVQVDVIKCHKEKVCKCHDECRCHLERYCEKKCDPPKCEEKWECDFKGRQEPCYCQDKGPGVCGCHCDQRGIEDSCGPYAPEDDGKGPQQCDCYPQEPDGYPQDGSAQCDCCYDS